MALLQPQKRSRLRLWAGKKYFTLRRYALWYSRKFHFARQKQSSLLPYAHFTHQTPLLRQLKDVDMQYQYQKIINLRLAAPKLHGILLRPGETFSYWRHGIILWALSRRHRRWALPAFQPDFLDDTAYAAHGYRALPAFL